MKTILIIMALFLFTGCAVMSGTFQHPVTKQVKKCDAWGVGWLGAPVAVFSYYECKSTLEKIGYKEEKQ
jgi:hypothetical protein